MDGIYFFSFVFWIFLIFVAIANAGVREKILENKLNKLKSHQVSTISLSIFIFLFSFVFFSIMRFNALEYQYFIVGLMWTLLTVSFEFIFGYFVAKKTIKTLISDYNIFKGKIWILVLIVTFLSPWLINKITESFILIP